MNHVFKNFTSALLGAAALASLATGCVREPIPVNPTYNPETNSVMTKLVLNVDTNSKTKMSAENVQTEGSEFLGMEAVHLLTYNLPYAPSYSTAPHDGDNYGRFFFTPYYKSGGTGTTIEATQDYDLGRLFERNAISSTNQSRTLEIALPLGTNSLSIYGKALNTGGAELQGQVTLAGDPSNLATISFGLTPRLAKENKAKYYAGAFVFQNILTSLVIAGLVKECGDDTNLTNTPPTITPGYWESPTGTADKRYMIWYPQDSNTPSITKNANGEPLNPTSTGGTLHDNQTITWEGKEYTFHMGSLTWKLLGRMYEYAEDPSITIPPKTLATDWGAPNFDLTALGQTLGQAYSRLVNINSVVDGKGTAETEDDITLKEIRAGSAPAILRTMRDLAAVVNKCATASPTRWEDVVVKQLAIEILNRIKLFFEYDTSGSLCFKQASAIVSELDKYMTEERWNMAVGTETAAGTGEVTYRSAVNTYFNVENSTYLSETTTYSYEGFPMNVGLPTGAAYMKSETYPTVKNKPERFLFDENIPAYGMGGATFNIFDYCYPAELMYYGNSPIRVANVDKTASQFPGSLSEWDNDLIWNPDGTEESKKWTKFGTVSSATRSVAMIDHINYGTALLKASVKYESAGEKAVDNYLEDNNFAIHGEAANKIYVIPGTGYSTNGLKVTGIVVGGQPAAVTWDFTRKPDQDDYSSIEFIDDSNDEKYQTFKNFTFTDQFTKMIYDKVNKIQVKKTESVDIYTLCWDNYDATKIPAEQSDVYIALELLNDTGQDFYGETNMVRNGGTFYLVGKMDLAAAKAAAASALPTLSRDNYHYPPFNPKTGETINALRVFMQDYMTIATLTINKDALKHAYVTVPDLRASQVSLGVSIDVQWQSGLTFNVEMGKLD